MQVLLPKDTIPQKLDRTKLDSYSLNIKKLQEELYNSNQEEFIIQDGEPYANGDLHLGHFLNKTLKDTLIKYYLKNGKKVRCSFGWDCHGLPIENKAKNMDGDISDNARSIALNYSTRQKETLNRFGIFSTEKDFLTMDADFIDRELSLLKELTDNNIIFNKNKPTWYSPTLKTVIANSEIEYKVFNDTSVYFFLYSYDYKFLVWTTTEWTIPGNQAICLNKNITYVLTSNNVICSESFAINNGFRYDIIDDISIYTEYHNHNNQVCPVLFDDYVQDDKTGIVHLCGGHGDDDFRILEANNIVSKNVCDKDDLLNHISTYILDEKYVYKRELYSHDYPVDWREYNKVYKVLTEQTYLDFDLDKIKTCLKEIKLSSKDRNRLSSTIFSRKDWCISRQRKWGVNIPNTNDILDVWFDSGSTFTMYDRPADIYIEGSDQHRGWFQSSVILAAMVGKVPTKRIITHGFITDGDKEKLSKSRNNYKSLDEMFETFNPDVMRLWVLLSDYKNDIVISEDSMQTAGKQYFKIRNFLRFLVNNLHRTEHEISTNTNLINDISKLKTDISNCIEEVDYSKAVRYIITYLNNYSSSLSEDIKNKFYESDINSKFRTDLENDFYFVYTSMIDIIYPFLPFLSVELKQAI